MRGQNKPLFVGHALGWAGACILAAMLAGCPPKIGEDCSNATDCSTQGDRQCDTTMPGGYCTIDGCDGDTCPRESVCVAFRYDPERLVDRFCMARCNDDGDCRSGYGCFRGDELNAATNLPIARVLDAGEEDSAFCTVAP